MSAAVIWRRLSGYFGNPDPRLNLGATVALAVVGNQPFYPLYVSYVAGVPVWPATLTWLSTPFIAAAPAAMRRSPTSGRTLLLAAALLNTLLATKALGIASGVELFYVPCLLLGFGLFEPGRRMAPLALAGAAVAAALTVSRFDGVPLQSFSAPQSRGLWSMNAISVICLCGVILFMTARIRRARATSSSLG